MERIEGLEEYPVILDHPISWGDMDAFAHVNNTIYFRHFENARIAYFEALGLTDYMKETGVGPILASTRCRFRIPLTYPDRVWIGGRVTDLGEDRFTMLYRVVSQQHGKVAAEGEGKIVIYDYRAGAKAPVPDSIREAIGRLEGNRGE